MSTGCPRSQALLGMDGHTVAEEMPSLGRWIQQFAAGTIFASKRSDEVYLAEVVDQLKPETGKTNISFTYQSLVYPRMEVGRPSFRQ